MKSPLFLIS